MPDRVCVLASRGLDSAVLLGTLALTLSYARPRGLRHGGRCTKCAERRQALARAGVPDPTAYAAGGGPAR